MFNYIETASDRAGIGAVDRPAQPARPIAIIGLGAPAPTSSTSSPRRPSQRFVCSTRDEFLTAQRLPCTGRTVARRTPRRRAKSTYFAGIYSKMHRGIVAHAVLRSTPQPSPPRRDDLRLYLYGRGRGEAPDCREARGDGHRLHRCRHGLGARRRLAGRNPPDDRQHAGEAGPRHAGGSRSPAVAPMISTRQHSGRRPECAERGARRHQVEKDPDFTGPRAEHH